DCVDNRSDCARSWTGSLASWCDGSRRWRPTPLLLDHDLSFPSTEANGNILQFYTLADTTEIILPSSQPAFISAVVGLKKFLIEAEVENQRFVFSSFR